VHLTEKSVEFATCIVSPAGLKTRQQQTLNNIAYYQKSHKPVTESLEYMKNEEETSWSSIL